MLGRGTIVTDNEDSGSKKEMDSVLGQVRGWCKRGEMGKVRSLSFLRIKRSGLCHSALHGDDSVAADREAADGEVWLTSSGFGIVVFRVVRISIFTTCWQGR
jgi:hypothetical protein